MNAIAGGSSGGRPLRRRREHSTGVFRLPSSVFCLLNSDFCLPSPVFRLFPTKTLGLLPARGCRIWQRSVGYLLFRQPLFPILCKFVHVFLCHRNQFPFHECFFRLLVVGHQVVKQVDRRGAPLIDLLTQQFLDVPAPTSTERGG